MSNQHAARDDFFLSPPNDSNMPAILSTREKAIEDARKTQAAVLDECSVNGLVPPPYTLSELIGKGSFGRVYKAAATDREKVVAVKIISIEEGDALAPGQADVFNDILKEVNTLKLLKDSGAKNINAVVDTLLIGQSVWMVTEYCAGGSVATLMRPTKGLPENFIIPILREVAEAIHWVHRQSIIHRDLKCANVLVHEDGQVQLIDFGVAGIIESKVDKRTTVTGTLQWMAPELFDSSVAYGTEVDIWAFGSMAYEMATGLPPNATTAIDLANFGSMLKRNSPRLRGDQFSSQLKQIVAFTMVPDAAKRPSIEVVQQHPYIANTEDEYPTESLAKLVHAYKLWERQGGIRQSLFSAGGAQGVIDEEATENIEWNFDTADDDALGLNESDLQAVYAVYGPRLSMQAQPPKSRRRQPPHLKRLQVPLEKVFDPKTPTNYEDHARIFYGREPLPPLPPQPPMPAAPKFPQRSDSLRSSQRHSLIDLDAAFGSTVRKSRLNPQYPSPVAGRESLIDLDACIPPFTRHSPIKLDIINSPLGRESLIDLDDCIPSSTRHSMINLGESFSAIVRDSFSGIGCDSLIDLDTAINDMKLAQDLETIRSPRKFIFDQSSPAKARRTQDWTFAYATSSSADPDSSDWTSSPSEVSSTGVHLKPEVVVKREADRTSALSMIDLDDSIVDVADTVLPFTTGFDGLPAGSNFFDYASEDDLSPKKPSGRLWDRMPSIYVPDSMETYLQWAESSEFKSPLSSGGKSPRFIYDERPLSDPADTPERTPPLLCDVLNKPLPAPPRPPPVPPLPSANVMTGRGSPEEVKAEMNRLVSSMREQLQFATDVLGRLEVRRGFRPGAHTALNVR